MQEITHIALFAGIGGDSLAARWAGFRTILFVENDGFCQKVLRKHWPKVPIIGDIRDATEETLANAIGNGTEWNQSEDRERRGIEQKGKALANTERSQDDKRERGILAETEGRGQGINPTTGSCGSDGRGTGASIPPITLVTGGFPCQPVSVAGKRRGKEDDRWLWPEMLRVISIIRPTWVVAENVTGLLHMGFYDCLSDLEGQGYETASFVIPACGVNAPHRRDRIFIVAYSGSKRWRGRNDGDARRSGRSLQTQGSGSGNKQGDVADSEGSRVRQELDKFAGKLLSEDGTPQELESNSGNVAYTEDPNRRRSDRKDNTGRRHQEVGRCGIGRDGQEYWAVEPDVGRSLDGFSSWLDGFDLIIPHMLCWTYGAKEEGRPREVLSALRCEIEAEVVRQSAGGQHGICEAEILLTYLCKLQEASDTLGDLSLESTEVQERVLRGLRWYYQFAGTSHRPESREQFTREHTDSLQALSRFLAHHSQAAWHSYRWENAPTLKPWGDGWELGITRVAHGVPSRVGRLKGLGNAIVPQQIYPILKAIADIEGAE